MNKKEIPTIKELEELEKQTKEEFTLWLIKDLKENLGNRRKDRYNIFYYNRILNLIKKESNKNEIKKIASKDYSHINYELSIVKRSGKKRIMNFNGNTKLNEIASIIIKEFDLEPMHLHEFEIGKCKYGPEYEEWEEIFDFLDKIKLGAAISAGNLKQGEKFKFLYDFGNKVKFKIEIIDIKE